MNSPDDNTPLLPTKPHNYGILFARSDLSLAVSTSVVEGLPDEQMTSPVRRTFLLMVLFDLILSFVLWIIYVQQRVEAMRTALYEEVVQYKFSTSLFDTVVVAFIRFVFLEMMYGALKVRVPWWSAGMTAVTSLILMVKCFLYDFHAIKSNNSGLSYAVIITALIVSWFEIGFLVYRVIPQERAASHVANCLKFTDTDDIHSLMSCHLNQRRDWYTAAQSFRATSVMDYHTPEASLSEQELTRKLARPMLCSSTVDIAGLLDRVASLQNEMWYLYTSTDFGKTVNTLGLNNVHNTTISSYPCKVYQIKSVLFAAPHVVFRDLTMNVEQTPVWNTSVSSVECVQTLASENIDIIHNVTTKSLQGLISPRDFVLLRSWGEQDEKYFLCSTSVEHPKYPQFPAFVRAHQYINACIIERHPDDCNKCYIVWFSCNDMKVTIPYRLLDKAVSSALSSMVSNLIKRSSTLIDDEDALDFITAPSICDVNRDKQSKCWEKHLNSKSRASYNTLR